MVINVRGRAAFNGFIFLLTYLLRQTIYVCSATGIVFVVDSSDVNRLSEVSEQLWDVLEADELRGVPLEIIANKQDLTSKFWGLFKWHRLNFMYSTKAV